jgi:hypothetical protein
MIGKLKKAIFRLITGYVKQYTFSYYYWNDSNISEELIKLKFPEINTAKRTPLCKIMDRQESDKGRGWHNYTKVYFDILRSKKIFNVFEMGIGSTKENLPNNMGPKGTPGASLKGWKDHFQNAQIVGADIDSDCIFQEDRIKTLVCDQTDPKSVANMWTQLEDLSRFQLMIDDGYHNFEANKILFENSIHKLDHDGYYVIEDISNLELGNWNSLIKNEYLKKHPNLLFRLCSLPNLHNVVDNNLLIICPLTSYFPK